MNMYSGDSGADVGEGLFLRERRALSGEIRLRFRQPRREESARPTGAGVR